MANFFDLVSGAVPITEQTVREAHANAVEARDELGKVTTAFREEAKQYRGQVAEILAGNYTPDERREKFAQLRTDIHNKSEHALNSDPDWVQQIQASPNDKVAAAALNYYFGLYTDMGFFNAAIDLYDKVPDAAYDVKQNADVLLGVAYAYNYRSQPPAAGSSERIPDPDPEKAIALAEKLEMHWKRDDPEYTQFLEPKIAGVKARAEVLIMQRELAGQGLTGEAAIEFRRDGLEKARDLHLEHFTADKGFHHYNGYNAMLYSAMLGDLEGAKEIAPTLYMAAMRDGGLFSGDPLTVYRTTLAMIVEPEVLLLPDDVPANNSLNNAMANLQTKLIEPWQRRAFIRDAQAMADALSGDTHPELERVRNAINDMLIPALKGDIKFTPEIVMSDDPRDIMLRHYSYTPASNSIIPGAGSGKGTELGGNLFGGGLIPDLMLTYVDYFATLPLMDKPLAKVGEALKADPELFPERMRGKTLKQLAAENHIGGADGTGDLYEATRLLVREMFRTRELNMENMGSHGHEVFEGQTRKMYEVGGLSHDDMTPLGKTPADKAVYNNAPTSANISHFAALRHGDCRMYKVEAALVQRIASAAAQNEVMGQFEKGEIGMEEALNAARDIRRVQLVNFDLDLYAPVKTETGKWPVRGDHGYFELNPAFKTAVTDDERKALNVLLEPHSVNLLVERLPHGNVDKLYLACTFYNGEYRDDKTGDIVPGATYDLRVELEPGMMKVTDQGPGKKPKIEIDLSGKTGFKVWDADESKAVEVPLSVEPSKHSHDLSYGPKGARRVYGPASRFLGNEMPSIDLEAAWKRDMAANVEAVAGVVEMIQTGRVPTTVPPSASAAPAAARAATRGA